MAFTLATNLNTIESFTGALGGTAIGSSTMAQVNADITSNGGLNNTLNAYYASSYGTTPVPTVAALMAKNLGIVSGTNGLADADVKLATDYITGRLNAAAVTKSQGVEVINIVNLFNGLASDTGSLGKTFGTAATAWSNTIASAVLYEQNNATDVTLARAATVVATAAAAPSVFILTNGNNPATGGADNIVGTAVNDKINGVMDFTANADTFTAGDVIDGDAGIDSLNLTLVGVPAVDGKGNAVSGTVTAGVTNNVEVINITHSSSNTATNIIDLSNVTGATAVNLLNSLDGTTLNVKNLPKIVDVGMAGAGGLTLSYLTAATLSTSDTENLTLNGVTKGPTPSNTFTSDGIETLAIHAAKESKVTIAGNALKTITVDGAAIANISTASGTITKVDASKATGAVTFIDTGAPTSLSITGGSGDDAFALKGAAIDKTVTIDGGAGKNTLEITNTAGIQASDLSNVKNIQTILLAGQDNTTIDMSLAAGLSNVSTALQTKAANSAGTFKVDNLATGSTVTLSSANLGNANPLDPATFALDAQAAATINVKNATLAANTSDALSIIVNNNNISPIKNTSVLASLSKANTYTIAGITANGIETVNLNSTGSFGANTITALSIPAATNLTITGDQALTIGTSTGNTSASNILDTSGADTVKFDASALKGKLTVTMTGGEAAHYDAGIVGGSGSSDSLTVLVGGTSTAIKSTGFEKATVVFDADAAGSFDFSGLTGLVSTSAKFTTSKAAAAEGSIIGLSDGATLQISGTLNTDTTSISGAGNSSSLTLAFNSENKGTAGSGDFVAGGVTVTRVGNLTIDTTRIDGTSDDNLTAMQNATTLGGLTDNALKTLKVVGPVDAADVLSIGQLTTGGANSVFTTLDLSGFGGSVAANGILLDNLATKTTTITFSATTPTVGTHVTAGAKAADVVGLTLGAASVDIVKFGSQIGDIVIGGFTKGAAALISDKVDILDFSAANVKLSQLTFTDFTAGAGQVASVEITFVASSGITGHIDLIGVSTADLNAANFVFA